MKEKIISCAAAAALIFSIIPSAGADNSAYVGKYYSGNTDGTGYAEMQITSCTDSAITLTFKRIKNDVETYTYTFGEGTVSGSTAVVPCHIENNVTGSGFDATATLTLGGNVKIQIISSLGSEMYTGTLPKVSSETSGGAETSTETPAETVTASANVVLNDTKLEFEDGAAPIIIDDRTYVPLRSVFSQMGINVYWDEYIKNSILNEQLITCTKNNTIIQFARTFNSGGYNSWTLNRWEGAATTEEPAEAIDIIDLQPRLIGSRSYVPLRIISETLGAIVEWEDATKTVYIQCDTSNAYWHDSALIASIEDFSIDVAKTALTDEYSSTVADTTPYFDPETKFFIFDAVDQWGNVKLRVSHGGFLDALPADETATEEPTEAPAEEPADETVTAEPTEETATETPTEEPTETAQTQ